MSFSQLLWRCENHLASNRFIGRTLLTVRAKLRRAGQQHGPRQTPPAPSLLTPLACGVHRPNPHAVGGQSSNELQSKKARLDTCLRTKAAISRSCTRRPQRSPPYSWNGAIRWLAAWFAVAGAVFAAAAWLFRQPDARRFIYVPMLLGAAFSAIAAFLDRRNARIMVECNRIGAELERKLLGPGAAYSISLVRLTGKE